MPLPGSPRNKKSEVLQEIVEPTPTPVVEEAPAPQVLQEIVEPDVQIPLAPAVKEEVHDTVTTLPKNRVTRKVTKSGHRFNRSSD